MEPVFTFPFKPYDIQEEFMRTLYSTVDGGKLGIFESPTGTGKSLSICCGVLQWLKDSNKQAIEILEQEITQLKLETSRQSNTDDWLQEEYEKIKKNQQLSTLTMKLDRIRKRSQSFEDMKARVAKQKSNLSIKRQDHYHKGRKHNAEDSQDKENRISDEEQTEDGDLILEECADDDVESEEEETQENDDNHETKIYISSRTHSQLSQFVGEIRRTVFKDDTRVVTMASRQHYCINPDVVKLKNVNLINERCLDMQKSKTKPTAIGDDGKVLKKTKTKSCGSCPYYNQINITQLKERMLVDIMDMEDIVKNGKELKACPYYASRMAMDDAQVVLISHAGVVSSGARAATCLRLRGSVLILDEAHNLAGALHSAHEAPVSDKQLASVNTYLRYYINKYRARLASRNLLALNQLSFVVGKLLGMLPKPANINDTEEATIYTPEDFVIKAEIDHMNLRPLVEFCRTSRLAPKLHGFSMRYSQQSLQEEMDRVKAVKKNAAFEKFLKGMAKKKAEVVEVAPEEKEKAADQPQLSAGSSLYAVLELISLLSARGGAGRVVARAHQLKYLLLDASERLSDVVEQCRSVIVAGGTMEPVSEFVSLLCGGTTTETTGTKKTDRTTGTIEAAGTTVNANTTGTMKTEGSTATTGTTESTGTTSSRGATETTGSAASRVVVLRCGHVVPPQNVLAACLSRGPAQSPLSFTYEKRNSKQLLDEVGRILRNVCNIVPNGVICFLTSYTYEQTVHEHLKKTNILDFISKKKQIFREPKSAADVDKVLGGYASAARGAGALLFSVAGGKLSEGLNFSDELGRCVLVVGMPYPSVTSPELRARMLQLELSGAGGGARYYEGLCMKQVNQCIGRAVRHANDYASVILVDERYSRPHTVAALPTFVQKSLMTDCSFGPMIGSMAKFFSRHKEK